MVRILPGESWKLNPSYLSSLKQLAAADARRLGAPSVFDVLGIEVDGVDLTRGQSEEAIFEVVAELSTVVARLCREPSGAGQVSFNEGRAELVLGRRGSSASLCLVSLRPARILTSEVEVEVQALALATASCAQTLASDLSSINPALAESPIARKLSAAVKALQRAARLSGEGPAARRQKAFKLAARPVKASDTFTVGFALSDPEGRIDAYRKGGNLYPLLCGGSVSLRAGADEVVHLRGAPFLSLTMLSRLASDLTVPAEAGVGGFSSQLAGRPFAISLKDGTATFGERVVAASAHKVARAFLEATLDFIEVLTGRNPKLANNPYLVVLRDDATERLARWKELAKSDLFAAAGEPGVAVLRVRAPRSRSPPARCGGSSTASSSRPSTPAARPTRCGWIASR